MMLATSGGGTGALSGAAAPAADGAAAAADGMTDEEFARMLQAEEDQARLLSMAGLGGNGAEAAAAVEESDTTATMTYEQLSTLTDAVGAVPRAASDAARARVTATRYESGCKGGEKEEEQCAVCRDELRDGDAVAALPCGHAYHPGCIDAWLDRSKSCPVCGRELEEEEEAGAAGCGGGGEH